MIKHHVEQMCSGDTTSNFGGAVINLIGDYRDNNFEGLRSIVSGANVVHSDIQQIDKETNYWIDNRIMADITLTNNGAQLFHFSGNSDVIGPPWAAEYSKCCICQMNPDPCQRTRDQKDACNECDRTGDPTACEECVRFCTIHANKENCENPDGINGEHFATSLAGTWLRTHKIRNVAIVRMVSDGYVKSNSGNFFRTFDHLYIKGSRLRNCNFDQGPSRAMQGFTWNGENVDSRNEHVYYADNQEVAFNIGGLHSSRDFQSDVEKPQLNAAFSLGFYRTTAYGRQGVTGFSFSLESDGVEEIGGDPREPIDPNQYRQYLPISDSDGNNYATGHPVTDTDLDNDNLEENWRGIGQWSNPANSHFHFDTCIYEEDRITPSSFKTSISGVDVIHPMIQNPYSGGEQIVPPADVRFSQGAGCDNNVCGPAIGVPGGMTSNGVDPITVTYSLTNSGVSDTYNIKFLSTSTDGNSADIPVPGVDRNLYGGIASPPTTSAGDIERSGRFIPQGYPQGGDPIFFVSTYDYKDFMNTKKNGGFNYTDHLQYATGYVPHKL